MKLVVITGVHKPIYGLAFLSSFLSMYLVPWDSLFQSSNQKAVALFNLFYLNMLLHLGLSDRRMKGVGRGREGGEAVEIMSSDHSSSDPREFPYFRVLGPYGPLLLLWLSSWDCLERTERTLKKEKWRTPTTLSEC